MNKKPVKKKEHKRDEEWSYLAPYPKPSAGQNIDQWKQLKQEQLRQEKLVRRIEFLATLLMTIVRAFQLIFLPITSLISLFQKKITERKWRQRESVVPDDEKIPPIQRAVFVADSMQAMDQNFYYVLKQGRLWFKPIAAPKKGPWRLFGPDGLPPNGRKLTSISSDGVNIIAIDDERTVQYVHSDAIDFNVSETDWTINNISLDWTDRWLSIPIIGRIIGLLRGHQLKLPEDCQAFAISQKGPETGYYTDLSGKRQPEFLVGVTTLYTLSSNGRIFFADPWLANEFRNEITAPEDGQFVAESMAAAASTIFLYRQDKDGTPCMYTRFADFDSLGSNPLLPASYDEDNTVSLVRRLPAEDWLKQPEIELKGQTQLTTKIAIIQTGRGQQNRQLRVEGTNAKGQPGYHYKGVYEQKWKFEVVPELQLTFDRRKDLRAPPPPPVDLKIERFTTHSPLPLQQIELKKFLRHGLNERGLHTIIELTLKNGDILALPLYARRGLAHFLGRRNNSPNWQLVLPKEYRQDPRPEVKAVIKALFNHKTDISVSIDEAQNGDITLFNKSRGFRFEFTSKPPTETLTIPAPLERKKSRSRRLPTAHSTTLGSTAEGSSTPMAFG